MTKNSTKTRLFCWKESQCPKNWLKKKWKDAKTIPGQRFKLKPCHVPFLDITSLLFVLGCTSQTFKKELVMNSETHSCRKNYNKMSMLDGLMLPILCYKKTQWWERGHSPSEPVHTSPDEKFLTPLEESTKEPLLDPSFSDHKKCTKDFPMWNLSNQWPFPTINPKFIRNFVENPCFLRLWSAPGSSRACGESVRSTWGCQ